MVSRFCTTAMRAASVLLAAASLRTALAAPSCGTWPSSGRFSIFSADYTPVEPSVTDGKPLVLGLRIVSAVDITATAVRFFKAEGEAGTGHVGKVYSWPDGQLLATTEGGADDSACAGGAWVSIPLSAPLALRRGKTYIVAIDGLTHYAKTAGFFDRRVPLQVNGVSATASVFGSTPGGYPADTSMYLSNYWIDVELDDGKGVPDPPTDPPTPSVPVTASALPDSCNAWPSNGRFALFSAADRPDEPSVTDNTPLVLGVRVAVSVDGASLSAVRFFKAEGEASSGHVGRVYSYPDGQLLASTGEVESDAACTGGSWVSLPLESPLSLHRGESYVLAVDAVTHYAKSADFFSAAGPRAVSGVSAVGSAFGITTGAYPSMTLTWPNYWVDGEFEVAALGNAPLPTAGCNTWPSSANGRNTIFSADDTPVEPSVTDGNPLVLGLRIVPAMDNVLVAVRFFKAEGEAATGHVGKVYSWPDGRLLATTEGGAAVDGSCPGGSWVSLPLTEPLSVTHGRSYVVAIDGLTYYAKTANYFDRRVPMSVHGISATASVFSTVTGACPMDTSMYLSNYWIDVEIADDTPEPTPEPTQEETAAPTSEPIALDRFGLPPSTHAPTAGPTPKQATCNTWPSGGGVTLFSEADSPTGQAHTDGKPLVIGIRIVPQVDGSITAVRFFKAEGEAGTGHVGKIYSYPEGELLDSTDVIHSDDTCEAPSWVGLGLNAPFPVTKGQTYVVAVDSVTNYAKADEVFGHDDPFVVNGLMVLRSVYGVKAGEYPYMTNTCPNYFVDVEFVPAVAPTAPQWRREGDLRPSLAGGGPPRPFFSRRVKRRATDAENKRRA